METSVTSPAQVEILTQMDGKPLSPDSSEESDGVNVQAMLKILL
jgi:hypothetical protein